MLPSIYILLLMAIFASVQGFGLLNTEAEYILIIGFFVSGVCLGQHMYETIAFFKDSVRNPEQTDKPTKSKE